MARNSPVAQAARRSSTTDLRRQLHWLPIRQHVSFKLGTILSLCPELEADMLADWQPVQLTP